MLLLLTMRDERDERNERDERDEDDCKLTKRGKGRENIRNSLNTIEYHGRMKGEDWERIVLLCVIVT